MSPMINSVFYGLWIRDVFIWNIDAWTLTTVAAFSSVTDFHHMDMHFTKKLFTFWVFASRCIFFVWRLWDVRVKYALLVSCAYMRACSCWLLLNWREKKQNGREVRSRWWLKCKIWAHRRRHLYMGYLSLLFSSSKCFHFLEIFLWVPRKYLRAYQNLRLNSQKRQDSSVESRLSTYLWLVL